MNKTLKVLLILAAVLAAVFLFVVSPIVGTYNGLVAQREGTTEKWKQVDVQLQRRYDLIPNLVATVKGYASHEQAVLGAIADARAHMGSAQTLTDKAKADGELGQALSRLLIVVENYPNLKADAQFQGLMDELAGTENRIAVARKDYNESVQAYNARIKTFPTNLIANNFGFTSMEYFEVQAEAKSAPKVDFSK